MKRLFAALALGLFVSLCSPLLWGQEKATPEVKAEGPDVPDIDPTATTWTLEKINNPPAREITFEVSETPLSRSLFLLDAKLLEHKYAAVMRLRLPEIETTSRGGFIGAMKGKEGKLLMVFGITSTQPLSRLLQRLLDNIPEDRRAKLDDGKFFASEEVEQGFVWLATGDEDPFVVSFVLLARTPEEAKRRSATLLAILDQGLSRHVQQDLLEGYAANVAMHRKLQETLNQAEANVTRLEHEAKEYASYTGEALDGLQLLGWQIDVEIAGVKARLAACEKRLLMGKEITEAERAQLLALQVAAQVELEGCEARRVATNQLVERVTTRNRISEQLAEARKTAQASSRALSQSADRLRTYQQQLEAFQPLPLVDGKVLIRPMKWTPGSAVPAAPRGR